MHFQQAADKLDELTRGDSHFLPVLEFASVFLRIESGTKHNGGEDETPLANQMQITSNRKWCL